MNRPGVKNILIGYLIMAAGAGMTWYSYSNAEGGGTYTLFGGAIAVGGIQLLIGLFQYISFGLKSPKAKKAHQAKIEAENAAQLAIVSMIYQSLSDKSLSDEETEMIKVAFEKYSGASLDKKTIRQLAKQMAKSNYPDEAHELSETVSPQAKLAAVRLSYLVAIADGKVEEDETVRLFEIARTIGVRKDEVTKIIEEMSSPDDGKDQAPSLNLPGQPPASD